MRHEIVCVCMSELNALELKRAACFADVQVADAELDAVRDAAAAHQTDTFECLRRTLLA